MKKVATTIRCVPRYGFAGTDVRTVDLDLPPDVEEHEIRDALCFWFAAQGIADAVYDMDVDDDGYFAIINDDVFRRNWGTPLL